MKTIYLLVLTILVTPTFVLGQNVNEEPPVLNPNKFRHYIDAFNQDDPEDVVNFISNAESWQWMLENIPFFECPDTSLKIRG